LNLAYQSAIRNVFLQRPLKHNLLIDNFVTQSGYRSDSLETEFPDSLLPDPSSAGVGENLSPQDID